MPETMQQVVSGVIALLRRPGDLKLHPDDVREHVGDVLKGYVQDMGLRGRDFRTEVAEVTLTDDGAGGYTIDGMEDFEPVRLEMGTGYTGTNLAWQEVALVPFESWERHYDTGYVAGALYGGNRLRLNVPVTDAYFRLSYRPSLLAMAQSGEKPPLPTHFIPMLKLEAALGLMPVVRDDTAEWKEWVKATQPLYAAQLQDWRRRWEDYLGSSLEPSTVPMRPYNDYRRGSRGRWPRAHLPIQ